MDQTQSELAPSVARGLAENIISLSLVIAAGVVARELTNWDWVPIVMILMAGIGLSAKNQEDNSMRARLPTESELAFMEPLLDAVKSLRRKPGKSLQNSEVKILETPSAD